MQTDSLHKTKWENYTMTAWKFFLPFINLVWPFLLLIVESDVKAAITHTITHTITASGLGLDLLGLNHDSVSHYGEMWSR